MTGPDLRALWTQVRAAEGSDIVPQAGITAHLTVLTAAAMGFLAVFALALLAATNRLADTWEDELSQSSTIRISAPTEQMAEQTSTALRILDQTPGIASARALTPEDQQALLAPWFGTDLPLETLPIPQLIEIIEDSEGFDAEGLRLRLQGEVPGAILDDHTRWRQPLAKAAGRLRQMGVASIILITLTTAALVTLAATASLAANEQVIRVMRLIGARDVFVARAFVRRFTLRAALGAGAGAALGMVAILFFPGPSEVDSFLTSLRFQRFEWLLPLLIPPVAAITAFWATRTAALSKLRGMT